MRDVGVFRRVAIVCATLAAALCAPTAAHAADGLRLVATQHLDARLTELTFRTPALASETHVRVLLPDGYDASGSRRYPMLLLLHGSVDDYRSWTDKGSAEKTTAGVPLIVVMPDTGQFGNYVNWYNDGAFGPPEWETYHIDQLLPWIDAHYRTVGTREGRAIAGLSMGGGGAMHYAAAHPDLFCAALSFSGALDTNNSFVQPLTEAGGLSDGSHTPSAIFGLRQTDEVRWRNANPWDLAENLAGMRLFIWTGNGKAGGPSGNGYDPVEDDVHQESLAMHDELLALGIPHAWHDYGPGGHEWYYWTRDLVETLPMLMDVFAHPPAPPARITYTRADARFGAYGWRVDMRRPAMEFATLRSAAGDGFSLSGSGSATVTTPPIYRPGSTVFAQITSGNGVVTAAPVADADGSAVVPVSLGPGNPYQQYSPQAEATTGLDDAQATPGSSTTVVGGSRVYTAHVVLTGTPKATAAASKPRRGTRTHRKRRRHHR